MNRRQVLAGVTTTMVTDVLARSVNAKASSTAGGSHTASALRWRPEVTAASLRFGVPIPWIEAVMAAESAGQTTRAGRPIISVKGAMGLMQLMPATYDDMRRTYGLGPDPYWPADNILAGTAYLRLTYDRFGFPGLFAAYNCGPDRYALSLAGTPLPAETRTYLNTVLRYLGETPPPTDRIFVELDGHNGSDLEIPPSSTVFVPVDQN
jgi:soluble lytic murein transglycosylase-like protein